MAKTAGGNRMMPGMAEIAERDYYTRSKEYRQKALNAIDASGPIRVEITNGVTGTLEITKNDIKTITGKNTASNKFNAMKNLLASDIPGYIEKARYVGWRDVIPGKHPESAYFVYYNRTLGENMYLCVRKMKNSGLFKPYAIIDKRTFDKEVGALKTGKPPR